MSSTAQNAEYPANRRMARTGAEPVTATGLSPGAMPAGKEPVDGAFTHRQILTILAGLMMGMFLAALDQTIVASAIRTIGDDLHGLSVQAWVTTAYLITSTITTPLYGKLSDLYGRRPLFLIAITLFLIGSAASAFSTSMYMLAAFRAFQGLGAGGLFSMALAILGDIVAPRERAKYQGYFLAVFGTSSVLGPVIGGFFAGTSTILWISGWRWVFLVNVPIGLVALVVVARTLHIPHVRRDHRIDYLGAALLVVGLVPLLTVLEQGQDWGWGSVRSVICYVVSVIGMVGFVLAEGRIGEDALIPLRFFRDRGFSLISFVGVLTGVGMFGGLAMLPLYLQIVKGATPTQSGLLLLPLTAGIMIGSVFAGQLISRTGRYKVFPIAGTALMAIGMGLMHQIGADTQFWQTAIYTAVFGFGLGNVMQPITLAVQNAMPPKDIGVATSSVTFFRQMGATIGTAVFLSILFGTVGGKIQSAYQAAANTATFRAALASPAVRRAPGNQPILQLLNSRSGGVQSSTLNDTSFLTGADQRLAHPFFVGFSQSMDQIFLIGTITVAVGFVMLFFLKELPLRTQSAVQARFDEAAAQDGRAGGVEDAAVAATTPVGGLATLGNGSRGYPNDYPNGFDGAPNGYQNGAPNGYQNGYSNGMTGGPLDHQDGSQDGHQNGYPSGYPNGSGGYPRDGGRTAHPDGSLVEQGFPAGARSFDGVVSVIGQVLAADGRPLGDAVLTLADLTGRQLDSARTGPDGGYRLLPPDNGTYLLICASDRFQPSVSTVTVAGETARRDITLAGASLIVGMVGVEGHQAPLPAATVALIDAGGQVIAATVSGPDGRYELSDLPPGDYTLTGTKTGHRPWARAVHVAEAMPLRADIELQSSGRFAGVVRAASTGRPVGEATVTLLDEQGGVVATVITADDGRYELDDVPAGRYTLIASGYAPAATGVEVRAGQTDNQDVILGPGTEGGPPRGGKHAVPGWAGYLV
jgi:EmrB/QacA subfamily drug resistance transporter